MEYETEFQTGILTPERLKPLQPFLDDERITDIDWNGCELWVNTVTNESYMIDSKEHDVTEQYVETLCAHIANSKHTNLNSENNYIRVESEDLHLRITAIDKSIAVLGNTLCLRKTTTEPRYTYSDLIETGYITEKLLDLLINCIIAGCNVVICGIPEAGKTEFGKYLSQYIPKNQKTVSIEDPLEWYYSKLNPGASCISLRVKKNFTYSDAISLCMTLNPKRIIIPEVKSVEAKELVELWHTGVPGITTAHTDDARKIPKRLLDMMPTRLDAERLENNIYEDLDIGILINKRKNISGEVNRYVEQICFYDRVDGKNYVLPYYMDGMIVEETLPQKILKHLERELIADPYALDSLKRK